MKPPGLTLDSELFAEIDNESDELLTTFRQDGVSIGQDYLRLEGTTISRGELLPDCLHLHEQIGKGAFSTVYRATWVNRCDASQSETTVQVAVKKFSVQCSTRKDMLVKEIKSLITMQQSLRNTHHSLVQLHGAFLQHSTVAVVLQYMDMGSLEDYLTTRKERLAYDMIASLAYQILEGLNILHDHKILHRDLKPANVLLDTSGVIKLCDFGLASDAASSCLNSTVLGTSKFMAPERLRGISYGRSSDLWSFGLCLLQCLTLESPWQDCNSLVDLLITVEESKPDDIIPVDTQDGLVEILRSCLQHDPGKYPLIQ